MGETMGTGNVADDDAETLVFADESDGQEHCGNDCTGRREFLTDEETLEIYEQPANDPTPEECVHCECCCTCLGCEYGPRDGMLMRPDQITIGGV